MVTGTPIPSSIIEAKSQGSSEVKRHFLSPDELEEIRRKYPTIKRGNDQMLKLTKEQYLNERKAGKSRNQIVKDQKVSPPVLYKALESWGIKVQAVEQEALAALNLVTASTAVKEQAEILEKNPEILQEYMGDQAREAEVIAEVNGLVRLPKDVVDELRKYRNEGWTDYKIIYSIYKKWASGYEMTPMEAFAHRYNSPFLRALADGYEVELTPEDKVREYYKSYKDKCIDAKDSDEFSLLSAKTNAIETVLTMLNIKIKGVNVHES